MSYWNHRGVRVKHPRHKSLGDDELEDSYGIREVYYNEDGSIYAISKDWDVAPCGGTLKELEENLEQMENALEAPVLDAA